MAVLNLGQILPEDAQKLVLQIAPRIGGLAERIAELCGCLPLALRLAASALASRPDISVESYAERLDEGGSLNLVETSIALSYELLGPEVRQRFTALAVFAGGFDAAAAAAVWNCEADEALGELLTSSLVEWARGRYSLHDLIRQYAASQLEEDEIYCWRHALYYCELMEALNDLYNQGGDEILAALAAFEQDWQNILAGRDWVAERAGEDEKAARLCIGYPDAGVDILLLRRPPRERIRWLEAAVTSAREIGERASESAALGNLGLAYQDLGEPRHAIKLFEQDLEIARAAGDRKGEGVTLGNLGNAYWQLGKTRRAITSYEQALEIAREIGNRSNEGTVLGNLGLAYIDSGETQRAIEINDQRLKIAREVGDRAGEGKAMANLGLAYKKLGKIRRAITFYKQSLGIAREIGDRRLETSTSWNLGGAYELEGEFELAVVAMSVLVEHELELGHPDAEGDAKRLERVRALCEIPRWVRVLGVWVRRVRNWTQRQTSRLG